MINNFLLGNIVKVEVTSTLGVRVRSKIEHFIFIFKIKCFAIELSCRIKFLH